MVSSAPTAEATDPVPMPQCPNAPMPQTPTDLGGAQVLLVGFCVAKAQVLLIGFCVAKAPKPRLTWAEPKSFSLLMFLFFIAGIRTALEVPQ